jgi:hypothetical protein
MDIAVSLGMDLEGSSAFRLALRNRRSGRSIDGIEVNWS